MMPSTKRFRFGPNSSLRITATKRNFRIGLITIDKQQNFWALTSARYFWGIDGSQVVTSSAEPFGYFLAKENSIFEHSRVEGLITRIRIADEYVGLAEPAVERIWPRNTCEPETSLGRPIFSSAGFQEIGIVTEADIKANVRIGEEPQTKLHEVSGAYKVSLIADQMIKKGTGGTVYLSENGDAVGLAVAYAERQVIVAPLKEYLEAYQLKPWAPLYAYWNNVNYRLPHLKNILESGDETFANVFEVSKEST